jgi:hypothetical protein
MTSSGNEPAIFRHSASTKYATASSVNLAKQPNFLWNLLKWTLNSDLRLKLLTHLLQKQGDMSVCAPDYKPATPGSAAWITWEQVWLGLWRERERESERDRGAFTKCDDSCSTPFPPPRTRGTDALPPKPTTYSPTPLPNKATSDLQIHRDVRKTKRWISGGLRI